ncbi:hypothetical protein Ancab_034910 [Ancistrocladus abbreviatus]
MNTTTTTTTNTTSTANSESRSFNSKTPYLFAGAVLMFGLISIALLILAYSLRKQLPSSNPSMSEPPSHDMMMIGEWSLKPVIPVNVDRPPEIVVIMAGDDKPTFLAKPAVPSSSL